VAAAGAVTVTALVASAPVASPLPAPDSQATAVVVVPHGLAWPGWTVEDPTKQRRELSLLMERERRERGFLPSLAAWRAPAPRPARAVPFAPTGQVAVGPEQVAVALSFALAQVGKPYVWGAVGPDAYDCSGLIQRSYATAGVWLPRTSTEQAQVGEPVQLADLRPGDLVFWAYDPGNLTTIHHVALYGGDGMVVQAPQPGEFVEVTPMWLDGYAGAVRVATGPGGVPLPALPASGLGMLTGDSGSSGNGSAGAPSRSRPAGSHPPPRSRPSSPSSSSPSRGSGPAPAPSPSPSGGGSAPLPSAPALTTPPVPVPPLPPLPPPPPPPTLPSPTLSPLPIGG